MESDVLQLSARLEGLSYFQLLSLPHRYASLAEVRQAFHAFAERFHPDLYAGASAPVREAAKESFKRAVEAYEVLRDTTLQRRYVENYLTKGVLRLPPSELQRRSVPPPPQPVAAPVDSSARDVVVRSQPLRPRTWVDDMTTDEGREVAERIERLITEGRWQDASLQMALLETIEPTNLAVKTKRNAIRRRIDRGL